MLKLIKVLNKTEVFNKGIYMKLKLGDKVKTVENHKYLSITKRHVGIVVDIHDITSITVKFKSQKQGTIIFYIDELKKVR